MSGGVFGRGANKLTAETIAGVARSEIEPWGTEQVRSRLLQYCKHDTLAMVRPRERLSIPAR